MERKDETKRHIEEGMDYIKIKLSSNFGFFIFLFVICVPLFFIFSFYI